MRLNPPPPVIGDTDGFKPENDLFDLADFGDRLANLVCRLDDPLVIALDGEWGSGKSTFVRQWAGLLRQSSIPVVLFDAFTNDHQEDAFISLASEIAALARARTGPNRRSVRGFIEKAKRAGRVLTPLAVKASIRAVTLGVVASEELEGVAHTEILTRAPISTSFFICVCPCRHLTLGVETEPLGTSITYGKC